MTFIELSDLIHRERREDYSKLLLTHADIIIVEVGKTNKQTVAKALRVSPQTFSLLYQLILAHVELTTTTEV